MAEEDLDITPMDIDEPDDPDTAVNDPDNPEEYLDWDRDRDGTMADHATDTEPDCLSGDDAEKGS